MDGLTAGRIVHIRNEKAEQPKCQPAIVVTVWNDGHGSTPSCYATGRTITGTTAATAS